MRAVLALWGLSLAVPFALVPLLVLVPAPSGVRPELPRLAKEEEEDKVIVAGDDKLVAGIRKAIKNGVSYLETQQLKNGSWPDPTGYPRGYTSLALLALLNSGVKPTDPVIKKGLAWLRKEESNQTYVVGLQTMVYCLVNDPADKKRIQRNVTWLVKARQANGWGYSKAGPQDNSNSQYALLGLHEAIVAGFPVERKTLLAVQELYKSTQIEGGWSYRPGQRDPSMTMTSAGLCNLIIAGLDLAIGQAKLRDDGSAESCGKYTENENIAKALSWIGVNFPRKLTEGVANATFGSPFYCLYGLERAGRLSGQRYFGGHDWYEVGSRYLVGIQKADGSWRGTGRGAFDSGDIIATSFSLLFLAKGRTPVLISKLAYGSKTSMAWNNKRSDIKNLVEFCGKELFKGKPLAWQVFDVRELEANDKEARKKLAAELAQSPIVYFNGHGIGPRGKEEEILKEFVANGGFILAENCCGSKRFEDFDSDFRRLMKRIFPDRDLKKLEPEHPVWLASGKYAVSPKEFPLEGIKQGCKTVVIYSPVPLAGYWEANQFKDGKRGQKAFQLGANIIAYATGLEPPKPRLNQVTIVSAAKGPETKRGYLQVAQLKKSGGEWQPAPKAMHNLMLEARGAGLDVVLGTQPVFPTDESIIDYRFMYLHGKGKFTYGKEDLPDLKKFRFNLLSGGLLLADACCGDKEFDKSFRAFVGLVFGGDKLKLEKVPLDDDLYSADLNGTALKKVKRRDAPATKKGDPGYRSVEPALEGVRYKGRWVVIYSRYDIGCALEKHTSSDCLGHDFDSALKLGRAAVLYALKR